MSDRRQFLAGSGALLATGSLLAADACSKSMFPTGESLADLAAGPAQYTLTPIYATHQVLGYTIHTRTYNGRLTGPTLETAPGRTLVVRVANMLPPHNGDRPPTGTLRVPTYANASMAAMERTIAPDGNVPMATVAAKDISIGDNPHAFNSTNLHVHGVQTIPHLYFPVGTSDPDATMIDIAPGKSFVYKFPIPDDHPSGLYWYHPHHHGSVDVQVAGGMAGLLVVRGPIDEVPEIAAAREVFLAIHTLDLNPSAKNPKLLDFEFIPYKTPYPKGPGYNCAFDYMFVMVNDSPVNFVNYTKKTKGFTSVQFTQHAPPEYDMRPGEVVRLRILNGTNFMFMPLTLLGMDVYIIERDGVNLLEPKLLDQREDVHVIYRDTIYSQTTIDLSAAGRAELLVRADKPGRYTLRSLATTGVADMNYPTIDLAHFIVSGKPVSMSIPQKLPLPQRMYPLVRSKEIARTNTLTFSEVPSKRILTGTAFLLNGKAFEEGRIDWHLPVGSADAWTLLNESAEGHAFHIHTNSFEVHAVNGIPIPVTLRDTIWIPPARRGVPGSVDLRIRYRQFTGKDVLHCHILPHECQGMMENTLLT